MNSKEIIMLMQHELQEQLKQPAPAIAYAPGKSPQEKEKALQMALFAILSNEISMSHDWEKEITPEWFISVGAVSVGNDSFPEYKLELAAVGPIAWLHWQPYMGCDGWSINDGNTVEEESVLIPPIYTRGQLRHFCLSLQVQLKEKE